MPKVLVLPVAGATDETPVKESYVLFCPACQDTVIINDKWTFDGNIESPTITEPIHNVMHDKICHATLTDGVWHYSKPTNHEYLGMDLQAVDVPANALEGRGLGV